jgi:bis(5'-nucleosidyl)-tetraphosphatase
MIKSCGAVIFRKNYTGTEYLLLRAYSNWDFPKGIFEFDEDENFLETAKREIEEETSLKHIAFVVRDGKKLFIETEPYGKQRKIARYYLCYVSLENSQNVFLPISKELGRPEHDEFRWVNFDDAKELLKDRVRSVVEWADKIIKGAEVI